MTWLSTIVAASIATTAAAALSRGGAVTRQMPRFTAVVTVATSSTATTAAAPLGTLPRHVALLVAIVADHGPAVAAAKSAATTAAATGLGAFPGDVTTLATVVTRTISHFSLVENNLANILGGIKFNIKIL